MNRLKFSTKQGPGFRGPHRWVNRKVGNWSVVESACGGQHSDANGHGNGQTTAAAHIHVLGSQCRVKEAVTEEFTHYDTIYITFKNRPNKYRGYIKSY